MKKIIFPSLVIMLAVFGVIGFGGTILASGHNAFLCPVVGDGVLNADSRNGDNGVSTIEPPVGTSLLPGKNKAGMHANPNAWNTEGPGNPDAGPGENPDFSPIWPAS